MTTPGHSPTAATLFEVVFDTLVAVLGRTTTATLMRKAAKNAARRRPDLQRLHDLEITRRGVHFQFVLPGPWRTPDEEALDALRYLVQEELCPLLSELTGPVVIRLLEDEPTLKQQRIINNEGTPS